MNLEKMIDNFIKNIFFITLFLFTVVFLIIENTTDLDLWHRLAVGKIFSQLGWVTYNDIFSYFPKNTMWIDHEWLSGVIFYNIAEIFGDYGLIAFQVLVTFLILYIIFKINRLISPENKYRISYYLITLIGIHVGLSSTLRSQCFTYLFFALWLFLLEKIKRGETLLIWIFPATMLLWANMHGGFLAGIGLLVFYITGELLNKKDVKKYLIILGLILPVTLINPYGFDYLVYIFKAVIMERPYITEWEIFNPLESFYKGLGFKILAIFLLFGYLYRIVNKQFKFDNVEVIALLVTFIMSIRHERHSVFFVIIAASFCYQHYIALLNATVGHLEQKISKYFDPVTVAKFSFAKAYGIYLFLIILSISILLSTPIYMGVDKYPVKEIEFIRKNNLKGNLLVPFNWGSYALWKLYPQNYVSIDGRFEETYKLQSYLDVVHFTILNKRQSQILDKYNHDIILIEKESDPYQNLKTNPEWKIAYKGEQGAVFIPASKEIKNPKKPINDLIYYVKTKYENNIEF